MSNQQVTPLPIKLPEVLNDMESLDVRRYFSETRHLLNISPLLQFL